MNQNDLAELNIRTRDYAVGSIMAPAIPQRDIKIAKSETMDFS